MHKKTVEILGKPVEMHISIGMSKRDIEREGRRLGMMGERAMFFPSGAAMERWLSLCQRTA